MSGHYFNTSALSGKELRRYESAAATQDERIAALFRYHAPSGLTPSQAHRALKTSAPITSIRRGITNLAARGVLEKTGEQVQGPHGRPEYKWRAKSAPKQQRLL